MTSKSNFTALAAATALASFVSTGAMADERPAAENQTVEVDGTTDTDERLLARMTQAEKEITDRTGMSAMLEVESESDDDPRVDQKIEAALREGWIVPATIDEVATALARAAETPSHEDDVKALELAHRGSYRYYVPEEQAEQPEAKASGENTEAK